MCHRPRKVLVRHRSGFEVKVQVTGTLVRTSIESGVFPEPEDAANVTPTAGGLAIVSTGHCGQPDSSVARQLESVWSQLQLVTDGGYGPLLRVAWR